MRQKKVFLSSVFDDCTCISGDIQDYRTSLLASFESLQGEKGRYKLVCPEHGGANGDNGNAITNSINELKKCDIAIFVLGEKYNQTMLYNQENIPLEILSKLSPHVNQELSLVHIEYLYAQHVLKMPIYVFVRSCRQSHDDRMQNFIEQITQQKIYSRFQEKLTIEQMAQKILLNIYIDDINRNRRLLSMVDYNEHHFAIITSIKKKQETLLEIRRNLLNQINSTKEKTVYFDQKYLYLTEQSVVNWGKWEKEAQTSQETLKSLQKLLKSETWNSMVAKSDLIADLGVGIGEKTKHVLMNILTNKKYDDFHVVCIDYSIYMIEKAVNNLYSCLKEQTADQDHIFVDGLCMDFESINDANDLLDRKNEKARIFMFLGGTIGNIDHVKFLDTMYKVMNEKDYCVITFFANSGNVTNTELQSTYKQTIDQIYADILSIYGLRKPKKGYDVQIELSVVEDNYIEVNVVLKYKRKKDTVSIHILKSTRFSERYVTRDLIAGKFEQIGETFWSDDGRGYAFTVVLQKKKKEETR